MPSTVYTVPTYFTAIDRFSAPITKMAAKVEGFAGRTQRAVTMAGNYFSKLMTPLTRVKNMLGEIGLYIGLWQLTRALRSAFNIIADFEQANVNLASVTEKSSLPWMKRLSDQARTMAVNFGIAATEIVNLQYELTKKGFSGQEIFNMTPAITLGAKALRTDADKMSDVIGGVLKAYNMPSSQSQKVVNQLAYAANATAADFESFATQLPIVNRVAYLGHVTYEKALAMLGVLRDVQIHTATGSTSMKNFILDAIVKQRITVDQALAKLQQHQKKGDLLAYTFDKYGKKTVVTAVEFAAQIKRITELEAKIKGVPDDYVSKLAIDQISTLRGRIGLLGTAWDEMILSIDEGNGPLSQQLKTWVDTARAVLLLSGDYNINRDALIKVNTTVMEAARRWRYWLDILGKVIITILAVKALLLAMEFVLLAMPVIIWAATVATKALAAAQWLLNAAMVANPIGLIITGVALLIGYILLAVDAYDEWGAAALVLLGPLGWMLHLIMQIKTHWNMIVDAFKSGGFIEGIKAIGKVLLIAIIYPLEQMARMLHSLTGVEAFLNAARAGEIARTYLETGELPKAQKINPKAGELNGQDYLNLLKGSIQMDINDPKGYVKGVKSSTPSIMPVLSPTNTFGY